MDIVFVYKYDGESIAVRPNPEFEGKNLYNLKDSKGVFL